MRISNYPTDTITGTEMILASNYDTGTQKYATVNFTVDTLKTFLVGTEDTNEFTNIVLGGSLIFEGATADAYETTLGVIDPTADRAINLPNVAGTLPVLAVASATAIASTPEELNILDGATLDVNELNILDGVTSTATELNLLDGVTATTAELNFVDGVTSNVQTQLNTITAKFDPAGTLTAGYVAVVNASGKVATTNTAYTPVTASELDVLSGIAGTLTATELNYVDGVTSSIQTQIDSKQPLDADLTALSSCQSGSATALALLTSTEVAILDDATLSTLELNILDANAGNTAVASDVEAASGHVSSGADHYKLSHTLTLAADLADDAEHADITITNNKVLGTSVVLANASVNANIDVHTVVAGSFKIRITNKSGGVLADDSTMIINYRII